MVGSLLYRAYEAQIRNERAAMSDHTMTPTPTKSTMTPTKLTTSPTMNVTIKGARQAGAPVARPDGPTTSAPAPRGQHRQEFPVEPLPVAGACAERAHESAWRGATRMLAGLTAARRVHPAGSARA